MLLAEAESNVHVVKIDSEHFPQMYKILRYEIYDKNQDGWLSDNEIKCLKYLYIDTKASSIKGLEYLTALELLVIKEYSGKTLSISDKNVKLKEVIVNANASSLAVKSRYLEKLLVTSVDGKYYFRGKDTYADPSIGYGTATPTKSLSVKECQSLTDLYVTSKNIVNYSFCNSIKRLEIRYSRLKKLSLSSIKDLELLDIESCSDLLTIVSSDNKKIKYFSVNAVDNLKNMNLRGLKALEYLYIGNEIAIRKLDLSKNSQIKLAVVNTWDHGMDVKMPVGRKSRLTKYDPKKTDVYYKSAQKIWDIFYEKGIDHSDSKFIGTDYRWNKERDDDSGEYDYYQKKIVPWNRTEFPELYDKGFSYNIDQNNDGWLTQNELDCVGYITIEKPISNLKGIEYFRLATTLDLKKYTGSKITLSSKDTRLNVIKVHTTRKEFTLNAPYCDVVKVEVEKGAKKVDVSSCINAEGISISYDGFNERTLSTLNLPKANRNLRFLGLNSLNIKEPRFKNYSNLQILNVVWCPNIKKLDVSKNKELRCILYVKMDKAKRTYDFSKCSKLEEIMLSGYKEGMIIKRPKGRLLPNRKTNFWVYEILWSLRAYRRM